MAEEAPILIHILKIQDWRPLSKSVKVDPLLDFIDEKQADKLMDEFALYILRLFQGMVIHSIKAQKFRTPRGTMGGKFTPLSSKWKKRKKQLKLKPGFWEATKKLQNSITYWKKPDGSYIIGFRPQVKNPLSGTRIDIIAPTLEMGSKKRNIPARPLFRPIAIAINRDIFKHFKRFIKDVHPEYLEFIS